MTTVPAAEYRANMRRWHERAQRGEEIVVTDNGRPTVRVTAARAEGLLSELERRGLLKRARARRPAASIAGVDVGGDTTPDISAARDR